MSDHQEFEHLRKRCVGCGLPKLDDLLWLHDFIAEVASAKDTMTMTEAAENIGWGPQNAGSIQRKLETLAEQLGRGRPLFRFPGAGCKAGPEDKRFLADLRVILAGCDKRLVAAREFPFRVRMDSLHLLNTRLVPELLEAVRQDLKKVGELEIERSQLQLGQELVEFDIGYANGEELLQRIHRGTDHDIVLTFCAADFWFPDKVRVKSSPPLRRGVLLPNNHQLTEGLRKSFSWEKLSHQRVIRVSDPLTMPDFPVSEFNATAFASVVDVATHPHAHAMVASGSGIAFTYPDLLREHEEQYCDAVVVPKALGEGSLYAVLSEQSLEQRTAAQRRVLERVFASIANQLDSVSQGPEKAKQILSFLDVFRHVRHTTLYRDFKWYWSGPGAIALRSTPSGFIKGQHRPGAPYENDYDIFGRVVEEKADRGREYHLLWRECHAQDEHYAASFVFDQSQLRPPPFLIGIWAGRFTLLADDKPRCPGTGVMVLSQERIGAKKLTDLVRAEAPHLLEGRVPVGVLPGAHED